jgi:hypothetical protein
MPFDLDAIFGGSLEDLSAKTEAPKDDLTNPRNIMLFDEWANASPEKRKSELVDVAFNAHYKALEADKTKKIEIQNEKGERQEISIFTPDGNVSNQGNDYLKRTKSMFDAAANSPTGGVYTDEFDGQRRVESWTGELYNKRKTVDPLEDYDKLKKSNDSLQEEGKLDWSFDKYVQLKNEELGLKEGDPARISSDNKALKEQFDNRKELSEVTKESFGEDYIIKKGGVYLLNPERIGEITKMKEAINALDISSSDKKLMLLDYRSKFNEVGGQYVSEAAAAEASSVSFLPTDMSGGALSPVVGLGPLTPILRDAGGRIKEAVGIDRQDLQSKFERFMSEGKGDVFDFAEQNADVFNKDNYSWGDKLSNEFWSAGRATGAGFLTLAGGITGNDDLREFATSFAGDSQAFTDMASKGLMNESEIALGITNKDLYNVGGQIANMMATFGTGSIIKAGLVGAGKAGLMKSMSVAAAKAAGAATGGVLGGYGGEYVGEAVGGNVGGTIGGIAGSLVGGGLGLKGVSELKGKGVTDYLSKVTAASEKKIAGAADELAQKSFIHRNALGMIKDPSAYIGSMQATGLSFGSEYNRLIESGVPQDQAYNQALNEGLASGASALIATSVFNRIAPGAERLMSGVEGSLSQSFVKNMASRFNGAAGMEATRKVIEELSTDKALTSAIFKGVKETMNESAKKAGLRGYGMAADVAAESIEEMTDEALNDVFSYMLDDSKKWEDQNVWANISNNFADYVKAGILGAIGGAMGGSINSGAEIGKLIVSPEARAEFKKETKTNIEAQWKMLAETSNKFTPELRTALNVDPNSNKALNLAEYVSSFEGPITPALIAEKSKAFTSMALLSNQAALETAIKGNEPVAEGDKEPEMPLAEAMKGFSRKAPGNSNQVLQAVFGENPNFNKDLEVAPDKKGIKITGDPEFAGATLYPVRIGNETSAIAMVEKKDGTVSYVSPTKAKELLVSNGQAKLSNQIKSFDDTISRQQNNIDNEWTTKQDTGSNANNQQKPITQQTNTGNNGIPQGDGNRQTPNARNAESAQRPKVALPTQGVASQTPVTYTDAEGKSYPAEFQGYKSIVQGKQMVEIKVGEATRSVPIAQLTVDSASPATASSPATVTKIANGKYKVTSSSGDTMIEMSNDAEALKSANEMAAKYNQSPTAQTPTAFVAGKLEGSERIKDAKVGTMVSNASKVANDAGIDVVVVTNAQEALDAMEETKETVSNVSDNNFKGIANINKSGRKVIIIHATEGTKSEALIKETIKHEMLHIAEQEFRKTDKGKALFEKVIKVTDKNSPDYDPKLEAFMEKEYPGYKDIKNPRWKMEELVRALIEGKMDGKTSGFETFKRYVIAFIDYVQKTYPKDSAMAEYINGVETQYNDWLKGSQQTNKNNETKKQTESKSGKTNDEASNEANAKRQNERNEVEPPTAAEYIPTELLELQAMLAAEMQAEEEAARKGESKEEPFNYVPLNPVKPTTPEGKRHAELEAKYNDGTITAEETAEAQALVEAAAKKTNYNRKGVRFGFYVNGVPLPPSRSAELNFGTGYYVAENATLESTTSSSVSVSPTANPKDLQNLGLKPEDVEFRRDTVFVKAQKPLRSEYGGNYDKETADFINAQLAYDSAVQEARRVIGVDSEQTSRSKTVSDLIASGRLPFDSVQGITGRKGMTSELVVQNASQIKSAEPFTGVPLDQRFNPTSNDIRMSPAQTGIAAVNDFVASLGRLKQEGVSKQEVADRASKELANSGLSDVAKAKWGGLIKKSINALYSEDTTAIPNVGQSSQRPVINESGVPSYVVSVKEIEDPKYVDSMGGRWEFNNTNGIKSYSYIPAADKTLDVTIGTVVSIGTDNGIDSNRVLVLAGIVGRNYVFKEINLEDTLDAAVGLKSATKLYQLGNQWNNNRLVEIADKIKGDLPKMLLADGNVSEKEFKAILKSVFAVIAPNFDTRDIQYKNLKGDSYFTTEIDELGNISISVDQAKMLAELRQIFDGYKIGQDATYNMLVATDVARMFAKWADEESIHMALLSEFNLEGDRDKLIAAANEAAQASGRAESIRRIYEKTAAERFDGVAIDALTDDQKIVVFHEVMRKVSQLVTSGSFTEMQIDDAKSLVAALNQDVASSKAKTGIFKGLKTVMELLHRYMRKMNNMLFTRQLMGQLSPEMQQLFQRVESATSKAGLRGDVDMIADKALNNAIFEYEQFKASATKDIAAAVFSTDSSDAINQLKSFVSGRDRIFANATIEELIEVDYIAGTLKLSDTARSLIEQYRPNVDIKKIDKALSVLNANPVSDSTTKEGIKDTALSNTSEFSKGRGESSVRLTQLQLVMANRALEAARYRVGNVLDMFNVTSASIQSNLRGEDRQGSISDDRRRNFILENVNNLKAFFRERAKYKDYNEEVKTYITQLQNRRDASLEKFDTASRQLDLSVLNAIKVITENPDSIASQNNAFDIAEKIGYAPLDLSSGRVDISRYVDTGTLGPQSFDQWLNGLMEYALLKSRIGDTAISKEAYEVNVDSGTLGQLYSPEAYNKLLATKESDLNNIDDIINTAIDLVQEERAISTLESNVDSDFQNLVEYNKALEEFNNIQENFVRRSLGDFGVKSQGYGLGFNDLSLPKGSIDTVYIQWMEENRPEGGINIPPIQSEELPETAIGLNVFGYDYISTEKSYSVQSTYGQRDEFGVRKAEHKIPMDWIVTGQVNNEVNPYDTMIRNNAAAIGRTFARDLIQISGQGLTLNTDSVKDLRKTGGFNFTFDDSDGPKAMTQFPSMPNAALTDLSNWKLTDKTLTKDLKAMIGVSAYTASEGTMFFEGNNPVTNVDVDYIPEFGIEEGFDQSTLFGALDRITHWMRQIQETVDNAQMTYGDNHTTLAGHLSPILQTRLNEANKYMALYHKHVADTLAKAPSDKIGNEVATNLIQVDRQDGNITVHPFENMSRAFKLLAKTVSYTRSSYAAYTDKNWNKNQMRELVASSRDAGFKVTKGFSYLRDYAGDPATDSQVEFNYEYAAGASKKYKVSAHWAFEAMNAYNKTEWSNDHLEKMGKVPLQYKKVPVFEMVDYGEIVFEDVLDDDGNIVYEKVSGGFDSLGNPLPEVDKREKYYDEKSGLELMRSMPLRRAKQKYRKDIDENGVEVLIPMTQWTNNLSQYNFLDNETFGVVDKTNGRPNQQFGMGEQSTALSDQSAEYLKKRMDDPNRWKRQWFSTTILELGMAIPKFKNKESARVSIDNARRFRDAFLNVFAPAYFEPTAAEMQDENYVPTVKPTSSDFRSVVGMAMDGLFHDANFSKNTRLAYMNEFMDSVPYGKGGASTDPLTFLVDLIQFKTDKELALIDSIRVKNEETVMDGIAGLIFEATAFHEKSIKDDSLVAVKENLKSNKSVAAIQKAFMDKDKQDIFATSEDKPNIFSNADEVEQIVLALIEDKNKPSGAALFYASSLRDAEQLYISSDKGLSLLLQNTIRDTLIYSPNKMVKDASGNEIGLRYFPSRNGKPGFLYAPQTYNNDTSREDTYRAYTQAMIEHAKIPDNAAAIKEFAEDVRSILNPHLMYAESSRSFNNDRDLLLEYAKEEVLKLYGSTDEAMVDLYASHLINMKPQMDAVGLAFSRAKVLEESLRESGETLEYAKVNSSVIDSAAIGYEGGEFTLVDDIVLFVEMMNNPKLKEIYDSVKMGSLDIGNTTLPDNTIKAVIDSVVEVNRKYEETAPDYGNTSELPEPSEDRMNLGLGKDTKENQGFTANLTRAKTFSDLNALVVQARAEGTNLKGKINIAMLDAVLSEREDYEGTRIAPSDAYLIQLFNTLLINTKEIQQTSQFRQSAPNRAILAGDTIADAARPILPMVNKDGVYNGNWGSMATQPVNGRNNTQATINFARNRRNDTITGMLSLVGNINELIERAAEQEQQRGNKRLQSKDRAKDLKDDLEASVPYFESQEVDIVITDSIIDQLRELLPNGLVDDAMAQSSDRILGRLNPETGKREGGLVQLRDAVQKELESAIKTREALEAKITNKGLDNVFNNLNDEAYAPEIARIISERLKAEIDSIYQDTVDKPDAMATVASEIVGNLYKAKGGVYASKRKAIDTLLRRMEIDRNSQSGSTSAAFIANKTKLLDLIKDLENTVNNDIKDTVQARFGMVYVGKQSAVKFKLTSKDDLLSASDMMARIDAGMASGELFKGIKGKLQPKPSEIAKKAQAAAVTTIAEVERALRGNQSTFERKAQQYKASDDEFVGKPAKQNEIISLINNLVNGLRKQPETTRANMIDEIVIKALSIEFDNGDTYLDVIKALLPTRTERLELINSIGFQGDIKTQNQIRQAKVAEDFARGKLIDLEKSLDKLATQSASPRPLGKMFVKLQNPISVNDEVRVNLQFVPEFIATRPETDVIELSKILKDKQSKLIPEDRYDFVIKTNAIIDALNEFSDLYAEDALKILKNNQSAGADYNYRQMIEQASDSIKAETMLANERIALLKKNISEAEIGFADLSPDLLATIADPNLGVGTIITATGSSRQNAVIKLLKNPKGAEARKEMFGHLVQQDGVWIMMAPTDFKRDLEKRFGAQGMKPSQVREKVRTIVLDAIPSNRTNAVPMSSFKYSEDYINGSYDEDMYVMADDGNGNMVETNLKGKSRKEVADAIIQGYKNKVIEALTMTRSKELNDKQKYDFNDEHVVAAFSRYEPFIRDIVYAKGNKNLSRDQVSDKGELLKRGTLGEVDRFIAKFNLRNADGSLNNDLALAQDLLNKIGDLQIESVFNNVFSELQGADILNKMISGLVLSPSALQSFNSKYIQHQDARQRAKFINDWGAYSEAIRVQVYLDRGFDGNSGRTGYEVQKRAVQNKLAASRKKHLQKNELLGSNSLDQAKARTWAWLEGIKIARDGSLEQRFRNEIEGFRAGVTDMHRLRKAQLAQDKDIISRWASDEHVELMRNVPATDAITDMLKDIFNEHQAERRSDEYTLAKIEEAQKALLKGSDMADGIVKHGQDIVEIFKGIADAIEITRVMSFKPESDKSIISGINSIVPMLYTHANVPGSARIVQENNYKEDPLELVSITESAMFGKPGRYNRNVTKATLRPINIDGITGLDSLVDDALYRMNVAPNYNVLRKAFGRRVIDPDTQMDTIDGSTIIAANDNDYYNRAYREQRLALANVAAEFESDIVNDSQKGVVNTLMGEQAKWLSTQFIGGALFSIQQLLVQTVPAVVFTPIKKLAVGDVDGAKQFVTILAKYGASMLSRRINKLSRGTLSLPDVFANNLENAVNNLSPLNIIRGGDGMEENKIVSRRTNRYGYGIHKQIAGRIFKEIENLTEIGMDLTIASGERLVSRALYMSELLGELNRMNAADPSVQTYDSVEALIKESNLKGINPEAANYARMKVNDMFGQADQAKKGFLFQTRTTHPGWNQVLRSTTRFSNHTASTSSNLTAFWPALGIHVSSPFFKTLNKVTGEIEWQTNFKRLFTVDSMSGEKNMGRRRMRQEAVENFIGTLGQNIMFQFIKPRVLLPLVGMAIAKAGGDDDDEATVAGAEFANYVMKSDEDTGFITKQFKEFIFGSGSNAIKEWRDPESARKSMYADLTSKVLLELAQAIPGVGSIAGYSPASSVLKQFITDDMSERLLAYGDNMKVAKTNSEEKGVRIYDRSNNWLESASLMSAPTAQLYNYSENAYTALKAAGLDDVTIIDYLKVFASNVISTREFRSAQMDKLKKAIQLEEMREKRIKQRRD